MKGDCKELETNFGELIKNMRQREGIMQIELARRSGVTRRSIEYYERAGRIPTLPVADRILWALNYQMIIGKPVPYKSA